MTNSLDPLPQAGIKLISCCYVNRSSKIQVARITNIPNWYFERVVFPGQRLIFEADAQAQLEIHTGMMASSILSDTIPCDRLAIRGLTNDTVDGMDQDAQSSGTSAAEVTSRLCQDLEISLHQSEKQPSRL